MVHEGTEANTALSDAMRQARAAVSQQRTRVQVEMPADAAAGFGAAEPAAARYEHQDYAALVQNLGNQAPANEAKDAEFEQLHSAKQTALDALKDQMQDARMSGDDVSMRRIQSSITNLSMAKDVASLKAALASAQAAIASSPTNGNTPDTPEQKLGKAFAEIKALDEKATKLFNELPTTEKEKEERAELERKAKAAEEEAEKAGYTDQAKNTTAMAARLAVTDVDKHAAQKYNAPELEKTVERENDIISSYKAYAAPMRNASVGNKNVTKDALTSQLDQLSEITTSSSTTHGQSTSTSENVKVVSGSLFDQVETAKPNTTIASTEVSPASLGDLSQQNLQQNKPKVAVDKSIG